MAAPSLTAQDLAALAALVAELIKPPAHLTEEEFAEEQGVDVQTVRRWRRDGTGPAYLQITKSATKATIRYRRKDIEAWEESRLIARDAA